MLIEEFEQGTGFFPTVSMYETIEKYYMDFDGDKLAFCDAYKKNADGLAEKIQREAGMKSIVAQKKNKDCIEQYEKRIAELEKTLEKELEWKPYESVHNVKQADYERLAKGAETGRCSHYMTDDEAITWICDEFDFNPDKVTIIHEIDEYEINRHNQLRRTGRKINRLPVYCATDYYYIRFNTSRWYYEAWNGQLQPFYD